MPPYWDLQVNAHCTVVENHRKSINGSEASYLYILVDKSQKCGKSTRISKMEGKIQIKFPDKKDAVKFKILETCIISYHHFLLKTAGKLEFTESCCEHHAPLLTFVEL